MADNCQKTNQLTNQSNSLKKEINQLRQEVINKAEKNEGNLLNQDVQRLSKRLDEAILDYMKKD